MGGLSDRRASTKNRFIKLRQELGRAEEITSGKACVYATGSFGREEAGIHSDLDIFIVGKRNGSPNEHGIEGSQLKRLDDILLKAELISATQRMGIQEFSGDGRWLVHYSAHELTKTLGTRDDDANNTLTARLLLLLESRPLIGEAVYQGILTEVIDAYWQDFSDHACEFMPAFLANDILRLWRTFCVNYEAGTAREPEEEKIKRKIKNYKLKHSRLLTCYSALLYLLAVYVRSRTVSPSDGLEMARLTPTERLGWLEKQEDFSHVRSTVAALLAKYNEFLEATDVSEGELRRRFTDKNFSRVSLESAFKFGDLMFEALMGVGEGNRFYRLLIV